jgi:pimeloyl-ACP methyl ester carboxylesterase
MPLVGLNSIELYYESHGDGPAVTFLHGGGGNHMSWWQQVAVFSRRYRCVTIDHRGFGRSTDPLGESVTRFADDLEALLDHLGIDRTALVAQSMGGRTATEFALRHPDRVWGLVLCDTPGVFAWAELLERIEVLREQRLASAGVTLAEGYMAPTFVASQPVRTFLYQQVQALNPQRRERTPPPPAAKSTVAAFRVPTLFVVGGDDPVIAPEIIQAVHDLMPGSEYREFPGAGHSVYWEQPDQFNDALDAFLSRVRVPGQPPRRGSSGGGSA